MPKCAQSSRFVGSEFGQQFTLSHFAAYYSKVYCLETFPTFAFTQISHRATKLSWAGLRILTMLQNISVRMEMANVEHPKFAKGLRSVIDAFTGSGSASRKSFLMF